MFLLAFFVLLSAPLLVDAGDNATAQAFRRYKIVPQIIPDPPERMMYARFPSGAQVRLGNVLKAGDVTDKPVLTWLIDGSFYTFMLIDPDAPTSNDPTERSYVHWFVENVPGYAVARGFEVLDYVVPLPEAGSGFHRYVFLAYKQPGKVAKELVPRTGFNVQKFVQDHNLVQPPVAGNFFEVRVDSSA